MKPHLLDRIIVVLVEPQNVVNIAATVRAMKNMGLSRLCLVRPDEFDAWRMEGIAHRAGDIIENTRIVDSLPQALAETVLVVGTTARARTAHRNYVRPRPFAPRILAAAEDGDVAILFGREDRGLENDALDLCHHVAIIPTDPDYSSLNLAQAVLLLSHELFLAAHEELEPLPRGRRSTRPATVEELESTYRALEEGLRRIDFFKARRPEAVLRTIRTVVSRAEPDLQEAGILRGIGYEISAYLDRIRGGPDPESESEEEGERPPGDAEPRRNEEDGA